MVKVGICGDVATQLLTAALRERLASRGVDAEIYEAPFDQVRRQLLTADSELQKFDPRFVVVWEAIERVRERAQTVEARLADVGALCAATRGTVLYVNAADGAGVDSRFVRAFDAGLDALAETTDNLQIVDLASLVAERGRAALFSPMLYYTASLALVPEGQQALAARIVEKIAALCGRERKVAVVDLDGTLWGGIAGEDGVEGIETAESPLGRAHADFQRWLKELQTRGILLAVCSKNDLSLAEEVFAAHPEMPLKRTDFAAFVANWDPKPQNVAKIAATLNLGLDSFVFLDDRKEEREAVRQALPDVTVPELPEDPAAWVGFLGALDLFETASASVDDASRTARYLHEAARQEVRKTFADEAAFLEDLAMRAEVLPLDGGTIPRVARLTQRTNQFNVLTKRYGEAELRALAEDPATVPLVVKLSDRFGDYGIVSVVIGRRRGAELFIDTWLMSCRVIGRGVEHFVFNQLIETARSLGVETIVGRYEATAKNALVKELFPSLGFSAAEDGSYRLAVGAAGPRRTFVARGDAGA